MTEKELREKVALLKDGQVVEIENDFFQAVRLPEDFDDIPCNVCELDSICLNVISTICAELEDYGKSYWYLKLAHPL